jgi:predicted RNase H-like nuclease (RuvC/YqgF family)
MSEANQLIEKLEQGVEALITKVAKLSVVVKNQEDKIVELTRLSENYKEENNSLNDNVNRLRAKVQNSNSDSEKIGLYKTRINELVKEIDSCISLLNG